MRTDSDSDAVTVTRLLKVGLIAVAIASIFGLPSRVFGKPMTGPPTVRPDAGMHEDASADEAPRATSMYWSLFPSIVKPRLREGQQVEAPQGETIRAI